MHQFEYVLHIHQMVFYDQSLEGLDNRRMDRISLHGGRTTYTDDTHDPAVEQDRLFIEGSIPGSKDTLRLNCSSSNVR